jgi:branched-chain amino acid transport system permease protein
MSVQFLVVGLGIGAAYAALSMALVTTYRGTAVINIAQGAMAMWSAYVYATLRSAGDLVLPVGRVHLGVLSGLESFLVGAACAVVLGALAHVAVFRPLRHAPPLARVVASVGVMLFLQALVILRFGATAVTVTPFLPTSPVTVLGVTFSQDRLWLAGIAVVIGVALWAYFRFTRMGLATTAGAENERGIALSGYSPDRLAAITWMLGSLVAGSVAMLTAPSTGLSASAYTLFVVPALACALLARLTSIGVACSAGLALGALQGEFAFWSTKSWWPGWASVGITDVVPFLLVIGALFVFGRGLPTRGGQRVDPLPRVYLPAHPARMVAVLAVCGVAALVLTHGTYRFGVMTSMIFAIIALSLVLLTGLVGQISLAQAAFAGAAGFTVSKLGTSVGFPLTLLIAAAASGALGLAVGLPALRIRGAQLAVVTLAAGLVIQNFVFSNPSISPASGLPVPDPTIGSLNLAVRSGSELARLPFGLMVLVMLLLAVIVVLNLMASATGRSMLAVRSNERAAAAAGINVAATKLVAFVIASMLAGVGGALIGYSRGQVSAESFTVIAGLTFLAFAYLGGITSVGGALLAGALAPLGIIYILIDNHVSLGQYYTLFAGLSLVATSIMNPTGIVGQVRLTVERLGGGGPRRAPRPATAVASARAADEEGVGVL